MAALSDSNQSKDNNIGEGEQIAPSNTQTERSSPDLSPISLGLTALLTVYIACQSDV